MMRNWRRFRAYLRRNMWRPSYAMDLLILGERGWGAFRLFLALVFLISLVVMSRNFFQVGGGEEAEFWRWTTIRYAVMPLTAFIGALLVASHYIRDIYELRRLFSAVNYLVAVLFSLAYPRIRIDQGSVQVAPNEENILDRIGGPGNVSVAPGNAALFERLTGPSNVVSSGSYFLTRLETIKAAASLQEMHGEVEQARAVTKDGIEVVVRGISFRYRMISPRRPARFVRRTPNEPYPYSVQAMSAYAYARAARLDGTLTPWQDAVRGAIIGQITGYISSHKLDHITAPAIRDVRRDIETDMNLASGSIPASGPSSPPDPRPAIRKQLYGPGARTSLKRIGAELIWVDIGHFEIVDPQVQHQRLRSMSVDLRGDTKIYSSFGNAHRQRAIEMGRIQAQQDVLNRLVPILQDAQAVNLGRAELRRLILMRLTAMLETYSSEKDDRPRMLPPG